MKTHVVPEKEEKFQTIFPPINLCGDNAAMIAFVGSLSSSDKIKSQASYVRARWPLSELNK